MSVQQLHTAEPLNLWSVTTLIDLALGKGPGLINWIVKLVATAGVDKRAVVRQIVDDDSREAAIKYLVDQRWQKSEAAKVRGTDVHKVAEALALGIEPPPVEAHIEPYVEQYRRWLSVWQPRFLMAEAPVYNLTHRYAGTCDGVMELQGQPVLFDYKTTEVGLHEGKARHPFPEVALQLVAYRRAELVGALSEQRYSGRRRYYVFDPNAQHERMPEVAGAVCIVISPHDCMAVPVRVEDDVWNAWLAVLTLAQFSQGDLSRRLFGAGLMAPQEAIATEGGSR